MRTGFGSVRLGLLPVVLTLTLASTAFSQDSSVGCGPNAHVSWTERKGNQTIRYCKCNAGYERHLGACLPQACARAWNRLSSAKEGGRQALIVLDNQLEIRRKTRQYYFWKEKIEKFTKWPVAGDTVDFLLYWRALSDAGSGLDELLLDLERNPPPLTNVPVYEAIVMVNRFRRSVEETQIELKRLGCAPE